MAREEIMTLREQVTWAIEEVHNLAHDIPAGAYADVNDQMKVILDILHGLKNELGGEERC